MLSVNIYEWRPEDAMASPAWDCLMIEVGVLHFAWKKGNIDQKSVYYVDNGLQLIAPHADTLNGAINFIIDYLMQSAFSLRGAK